MVSYKALNTISECPIPNAGYAIRNNNISQRSATTKCIIPNAGNTVWDNEAIQRPTGKESIIS